MPAGELDRRVTFRRRAVRSAARGNARGEFADFCTRFARYRPGPGSRAAEGGQLQDLSIARLWIRSDPVTATIGVGDAVAIGDVEFAIIDVPPPMRRGGLIEMLIQSTRAI